MNMHEHDQDLIMALAEGSLGEDAASAARAEIAGCAECGRDLELQRLALSALGELPAAYLTSVEAARLHDNLKRELALAAESASRRRPAIAWGRWIPVAAAAALLLAVVVSVPGLIGGDDDSTETIALNDMSTTVAATEEAQAPVAAGEAADEMAGRLGADSAAATTTAAAAETATTAAAETTQAMTETTAASATGDLEYGFLLPFGSVEELDRDELLARIVSEGDELRAASAEVLAANPDLNACLERISSPDAMNPELPANGEPILLATVTDDTGSQLLLVAFVPEDVDQTVLATLSPADCEIAVIPIR